MAGKVFSCSFAGLECKTVEVQADISSGLPSFSIVGLGDTSVQESKERVRTSIKNSGAKFPLTRKTINLAPAQLRKQGSHFDLAIATSILLADNQISPQKITNSMIIGELSLTGKVKRITGALPITQHAKEKGFTRIFLPKENAQEASFIEGIEIYPLTSFKELIEYCLGQKELKRQPHSKIRHSRAHRSSLFTNIVGLEKAKRGLLIAAAGGHNTLLYGSPGCGKTVICRAFRSLLTDMTKSEILETTTIFSIGGLLNSETPIIKERSFREVHHTATLSSIIGGGTKPKPGEISLAHNGVLFLDEIAEFPKQILEALRQPLEDKHVNINRINSSMKFPSNFILLATMNPCPCGYKGDKKIPCICSQSNVERYQKKISGPLLDRFDIFIEVAKTSMGKIFSEKETTQIDYHKFINIASEIQKQRFKNHPRINKNADMNLKEIKRTCQLTKDSKLLLNQASKNLKLSNRGYLKTIKIARTIADLDQSEKIQQHHIAEAIQFRSKT
ncbi:MAG: YifB family Mg chelatase-like AAA ATPase [Nitrospirae bacterium]|nr:YifB family Mg chelatase-like AAA ATPase [Nitrospirota bacterium]